MLSFVPVIALQFAFMFINEFTETSIIQIEQGWYFPLSHGSMSYH